jgi:hypothetical protein
MKIRTKAMLEIIGTVVGTIVAIKLLDYVAPGYGWTIYMLAIGLYLLWCVYNFRVGMLEREQNEIVDTLKK